jgi:formylglycine-generating enzyme required for sulfatase activity
MYRSAPLSLAAACLFACQCVAQVRAEEKDPLRQKLAVAQQEFLKDCEAASHDLLMAIDAALQDASSAGDFPKARRLSEIKIACEKKGLLPTDQSVIQARREYDNRFIEIRTAVEAAFDEVVAEYTKNGNLDRAQATATEKANWLQRVRSRKTPQTRYIPATEFPQLVNSVGMTLVLLPSGTFTMGTVAGTARRESPPHEVTLTKPFYMSAYEVTNEAWKRVMGEAPSDSKDPNLPVTRVNWSDSMAFCEKLSAKQEEKNLRLRYRLPTEAEWEYACRAGSTTPFCFGDDEAMLAEYGWFKANADGRVQPVGKKRPNEWGLFDMHGNLLEWVADWSSDSYYSQSPKENPTGPAEGRFKQSRGGDWGSDPPACRSATRRFLTTTHRWETLGFRVVAEKY